MNLISRCCWLLLFFPFALAAFPALAVSDLSQRLAERERALAERPEILDAALRSTNVSVGPGPGCNFSDLQVAIDAAPSGGIIRVTSTYSSNQAGYVIGGTSLVILGGYDTCAADSPASGISTLDAGGSGRVMAVFGSTDANFPPVAVTLVGLDLIGGGGTAPIESGGLFVQGRPGLLRVTLIDVLLTGNARSGAQNAGGGIRMIVQQGPPTSASFTLEPRMLELVASSLVGNQTQDLGGGLFCFADQDPGNIELIRMSGGRIAENQALNGGGVALQGCRNVVLQPDGLEDSAGQPLGGIYFNRATDSGGGLWLRSGAQAEFSAGFNFVAGRIVSGLLAGNEAASSAAARVWDDGSALKLHGIRITGNQASTGEILGVFAISSASMPAALVIEGPGQAGGCAARSNGDGSFHRPPCSLIENNQTPSELVRINSRGTSVIRRSIVRNNVSDPVTGRVFAVAGGDSSLPAELQIVSSLIHDNPASRLIVQDRRSLVETVHSTLIGDVATFISVSGRTNELALFAARASILINRRQSALSLVAKTVSPFSAADAECVLTNKPEEFSGFDLTSLYLEADARFLDESAADFRLADDSPAIDFCFPVQALEDVSPDLAGNPRGVVWTGGPPAVPNLGSGPFDLGAYEAVKPNSLFRDRFQMEVQ